MNRPLLLMFVFMFSFVGFGQDSPTLVDEFGPIPCDDMLARVDNFAIQLHNDPTVTGLVIVSGSHQHLIKKLQLEILFTSSAFSRRLDASQVRVVRGSEEGEPKMRLYVMPSGVNAPISATTWNLTIPTGTKPSLFAWEEDAICSYPTVYKYLKELLGANPGLKLNVVLAEPNSRKFRRKATMIQEVLGEFGKKRIRFFYDHPNKTVSADFWIIP